MEPTKIALDLKEWSEPEETKDQLCSNYSPPAAARIERHIEAPDLLQRYNPGVSFLEVSLNGRVHWFIINPTLPSEKVLLEAKEMVIWLYENIEASEFTGFVGDTNFSRWLWIEEMKAKEKVLRSGAILVLVNRDQGYQWATNTQEEEEL